ncbi:MAG TPA: ATP-grasp domain-containing protein [Kiritimatiellia bacterium]|nr:ATP-grasp domain-containing protein [Kiritimatiellia bacterium]HRZ11766.1 ATP-grasp domain-containing protein [Kiritimatiellia bacterium]HSA17427.1 ATP-grasp domain-containing protein [Kiritimatiellia bacterium]
MKPEPATDKTIFILGAGIYQAPLIRQARIMGLRVLVASRPGPYPGFALADRAFHVDTTDAAAVLGVARAEKIDGICTSGTDVALAALGGVVDALGVPGPSAAATAIATNKLLMRRAGRQAGVRMPEFRAARTAAEALTAARELGTPVMVKAVDSSGSRGVVKVRGTGEIDSAVAKVRAVTRREEFLVEQFIEGADCGAEAFVLNGRVVYLLPTGCTVFEGEAHVPIGHHLPHSEGLARLAEVRDQVERCVRASRLDHCAMNFDFIVNEAGVHVIEFGARAGATCLPELAGIYGGFNYYEQILRAALGGTPEFPAGTGTPCAAVLLRADRDGVIREQRNENGPDPEIVDVSFDYRPGDRVRRFRVGPDRIGHIIAKGARPGDALAALDRALRGLRIVIE